jgi:hypothetical protein
VSEAYELGQGLGLANVPPGPGQSVLSLFKDSGTPRGWPPTPTPDRTCPLIQPPASCRPLLALPAGCGYSRSPRAWGLVKRYAYAIDADDAEAFACLGSQAGTTIRVRLSADLSDTANVTVVPRFASGIQGPACVAGARANGVVPFSCSNLPSGNHEFIVSAGKNGRLLGPRGDGLRSCPMLYFPVRGVANLAIRANS